MMCLIAQVHGEEGGRRGPSEVWEGGMKNVLI